jgi:hypothetical protein
MRCDLANFHQNDHFIISHFYQDEDADVADDLYKYDNSSTGSVVRTPGFPRRSSHMFPTTPLIQKMVNAL